MPKCCIGNCDTHNLKNTDHIAYFKFPLHDDELLAKWLRKIPRQPEGWRPNDKTFICSWHFRSRDIDKNPKRDFLLLRANAAPTLFKKVNPNHQPWPINIQDQVKKIVPVPRHHQVTTPAILSASDLLGGGGGGVDAIEDPAGIKYRKILPRANTVTQILVPTESISTPMAPSNSSYFLLVPTCENLQVDTSQTSALGQKAVLTIKVARKTSDDPLEELGDVNADDLAVPDNVVAVRDVENVANDDPEEGEQEELVIYSEKYKKYIVFTLDPETNGICVSRRNACKRDAADDVAADEPATKVSKIVDEAAALKDQYVKAQQEYTALQSRVQDLRKQCLVETEAIAHLEDKLREPATNPTPVVIVRDTIDEDLERMMADSPEKIV